MSKYPNQYHSTSRVPVKVSQSVREQRMKEQWQFEPLDDASRKAAFDYMEALGLPAVMKVVHYDGQPKLGIEMPYTAVEHLAYKAGIPLDSFEAYRRKSQAHLYTKWLKDMKPVGRMFGARFQGTHPTTVLQKPPPRSPRNSRTDE